MSKSSCLLSAGAVLLTACVTPDFVGLPDLPNDVPLSYAYGISTNGRFITGESFSPMTSVHGMGVRWYLTTAGWDVLPLGLLPAPPAALNSPALGLDSDGSVHVGRVSFGAPTAPALDTLAYAWRPGVGMTALPLFPGDVLGAAHSATEGAVRVVGWGNTVANYETPHALVWEGSFGAWPPPKRLDPEREGMALAIDVEGKFIVGWGRSADSIARSRNGIGHEAVCWRRFGSTWVGAWLGALPGEELYSHAGGIARRGGAFAVGFSGDPGVHSQPVRWRLSGGGPAEIRDLGLLPGFTDGGANAVTSDGRRVVGNCTGTVAGEFVSDSFVWDEGSGEMRSIKAVLESLGVSSVKHWKLTGATGVSDDGHVICGYGTDHSTNPLGVERAWVATLP